MHKHTHTHTHTLDTSHNKFPAVSYVAVEADLPEGAAHDYDEINNSGVVHVHGRRRI